jgi:hypothetical protein
MTPFSNLSLKLIMKAKDRMLILFISQRSVPVHSPSIITIHQHQTPTPTPTPTPKTMQDTEPHTFDCVFDALCSMEIALPCFTQSTIRLCIPFKKAQTAAI